MKNKRLFLLFLLLLSLPLAAKIKLQPFFSNEMVLQQQTQVPIWGESEKDADIRVFTSWDKKHYVVKADQSGRWQVTVSTPKAGGPYRIEISDGTPLVLSNVLIGEVWICSGQSNMEMPMQGWNIKMNEDEIARAAQHTNIRLFQVEKKVGFHPQSALDAVHHGWTRCTPETLQDFSATAFFFGRQLAEFRNVPVGLIMTCWGGTPIESWMSGEDLKKMAVFNQQLAGIGNLQMSVDEAISKYNQDCLNWGKKVASREGSYDDSGKALWAMPSFDDSSWKIITQPKTIENADYPGYDGVIWYRKNIQIPSGWAGKQLDLWLSLIDDDDITYFNGVEVGRTVGYSTLRQYKIPAELVAEGKAVITVRCMDSGGNGGFWGEAKDMHIGPSGEKEQIDLASEWKVNPSTSFRDVPYPINPNDPNIASVLYNSMIHPLIPYAIKGVIWYQGESNAGRAYQYRDLLPLLIQSWRREWKQPFPFLIVQLANYMKRQQEPENSAWAELREAQLKTLTVENTGLAVAIDIGMENDIHPTNKQEVGRRLGLAARKVAYGENLPYSGPIFQSFQLEGKSIRIHFEHTNGGLKAKDVTGLQGFTVAGVDHFFHWANARIEGNSVVVSSPEVDFPVAVRYGWADNPIGNLYNGFGLPASPFRTDDWPGVTLPR